MSGLDWFTGDLPCNRRIVATLLDVLLQSGETTAHVRVRRRLDLGVEGLPRTGAWLDESQVHAAFTAAGDSPRLARRVGQALVRLEGLGLLLCHSGIATVEKAYRRSHQLLAREAEEARYAEPQIDGDRAVIRFEPAPSGTDLPRMGGGGAIFCEMRRGMLEALPMVFGLLPAHVRETSCAHRGAEACTFEVKWSRQARRGLFCGLALGVLGTAAALAWSQAGGPSPLWMGPVGLVATGLCMAAGRAYDLSRQLEAVAGARRGQLALLDQVDQSLAEKLDELAKIGAAPALGSTRVVGSVPESGEGLVPVRRDRENDPSPTPSASHERLLLSNVLERALASVSRGLDEAEGVRLPGSDESAAVLGDSLQLEFMLEQLLLNALDASGGAQGVRLGLGRSAAGIELTVEDSGPGIEAETLDEAFDPFFDDATAGVTNGLGLPICYRIVAEHGGQLHVESRPGEGTRIRVHLPEAPPA